MLIVIVTQNKAERNSSHKYLYEYWKNTVIKDHYYGLSTFIKQALPIQYFSDVNELKLTKYSKALYQTTLQNQSKDFRRCHFFIALVTAVACFLVW